jgi:hypothetical protein
MKDSTFYLKQFFNTCAVSSSLLVTKENQVAAEILTDIDSEVK